ncbi:MAG: GNAT family N-acetyltransferase [Hyphomicrobium sp.]
MDFRPASAEPDLIRRYSELLRLCFPGSSKFTTEYLTWLYAANPIGTVFGTDAFDGVELVGHYACVPSMVAICGRDTRALLSINTATHPEFRGKGLFTQLAEATFERAAEGAFQAVYGVANQNSVEGFVRRLGFQNVRGLEARIGMGLMSSIDWPKACAEAELRRLWPAQSLCWRLANPLNPLTAKTEADGLLTVAGRTQFRAISAVARLAPPVAEIPDTSKDASALQLTLGLEPAGTTRHGLSAALPDFLKPSPLRLIYRHLQTPSHLLDPERILFNFLDFDAY